ncbi:MAG: sigma-70 family RNA polymerase sigma factor, partial [Marinoscillum sp.]|uniref:RNA polymerase sigma factor n=1 Tax=Marinoscillum sp. TaxID=2024838 RepID=UPI0032F555A0
QAIDAGGSTCRGLKYRTSYKAGSNFEFWLFQIARNQVKDHFRKMKIHRDQFQAADVLPDHVDDLDEEQREREQRLMQALSMLPEEKREILVLSKFEGMKYEQIAALKSISVSAVKVQVHRTIKQLKELYFEIKN